MRRKIIALLPRGTRGRTPRCSASLNLKRS